MSANDIEVVVKGDLPKTVYQLRRLATEEHFTQRAGALLYGQEGKLGALRDEEWGRSLVHYDNKFSVQAESRLISYLRHKHTNYEELIKGVRDDYVYQEIKKRCNEKAYELLAKIRESNR